jgi:hypothetical protein
MHRFKYQSLYYLHFNLYQSPLIYSEDFRISIENNSYNESELKTDGSISPFSFSVSLLHFLRQVNSQNYMLSSRVICQHVL